MAFVYEARGLDGLGQRIHFRNDFRRWQNSAVQRRS